jgi:tripartite-type tricarboxylate transporter receptor subunit TctC
MMRRLIIAVLTAAGIVLASGNPSRAEYPERPVRLLVPFPAGGAVDLVARLLSARLSEAFGRSVVVDNKPGAGGIIATDATAKAPPDGYTLLFTTPNHTINAALRQSLPYDTEKDLIPVSLVAEVPEVLVSYPGAPFTTFAGFIDYAKQHPGELNYASAGNGTLPHVTMELLLRRTGIEVTHIPYKGAAPALTDLLAGQVQLKMDTYATSAPFAAEGKLRQLAIASRKRSALAPNMPTIAESGLPGYEGILWLGIVAPKGTPRPIVEKLASACADAVRLPEMITRFQHEGIDPAGSTPEAFGALIEREINQWRELNRDANISLD